MFDVSCLDRNKIDTHNEFAEERTVDQAIADVRGENVVLSLSASIDDHRAVTVESAEVIFVAFVNI